MKILVAVLIIIGILPIMNAERCIYIDKEKCELIVIDEGDTMFTASVCLGRARGQKTRKNDGCTPEGDFEIWMIQDSRNWLYDPENGGPLIPHVYGPWFFRLKTPMSTHIGIHGTSKPSSIGKRSSKGCIRLKNEDVVRLRDYVYTGMPVHITSDKAR